MSAPRTALDLFAGHGWGVACQRIGIEEAGVEIMPEARAIREANGMRTPFADVWDVLLNADPDSPEFQAALEIASPPCQTFSMAGSGAGRKALDEVLALIDERAYLRPADLYAFGQKHDPRTALVLTPLASVALHAPTFVVWEQVPPVLPVWERAAVEMRAWGYSVWTGILNAEQYGVPQTRRRAVLIARADGVEATPPRPTHSRYYSHDPKRLDPDVAPWVSMAEALGWGMTERPMVTAGNAVGRAEGVGGSGAKAAIVREKERGAWQSNQNTSTTGERYERDTEHPAPTITAGQRSARWLEREGLRGPWGMTDRPYPTVASGTEAGGGTDPLALGGSGARKTVMAEKEAGRWIDERPATTIAGDSRVWPPGHKVNASDVARLGDAAHERYGDRAGTNAERVTVAEAAALQSYPPGFVWDVMVDGPKGPKPITRTKQFLTIGNAVPPLLAEAILRTFDERPTR